MRPAQHAPQRSAESDSSHLKTAEPRRLLGGRRHLDFAYVTVDVTPPPAGGGVTRISVRAIIDAGLEIDRVDLEPRTW